MRNAKVASGFEKFLTLLTILFINICLIIPVWQSAENTQLKFELAESENYIRQQEEQKMLLSASIARQTTPEYLVEQSVEQNIVFKQIGETNLSLVASSK